jgi:hypothetical protein
MTGVFPWLSFGQGGNVPVSFWENHLPAWEISEAKREKTFSKICVSHTHTHA